MTHILDRLLREEDGTCMTDARGMYGWVVAAGVAAYFLYGHRLPELIFYIDQALPQPTHYSIR